MRLPRLTPCLVAGLWLATGCYSDALLAGDDEAPCLHDDDCPAGRRCSDGFCLSVRPSCASNDDCQASERCDGGVCVDDPGACASITDCALDEVCLAGRCERSELDCNGAAPVRRSRDGDGDGLGGPEVTLVCLDTPGFVTNVDDCDDADPDVGGPVDMYFDGDGDGRGAPPGEVMCLARAGADRSLFSDDCDDADPHVGGPITVYVDFDGDGGGDPASAALHCPNVLMEWVTNGYDCDDTDPSIRPWSDECLVVGDAALPECLTEQNCSTPGQDWSFAPSDAPFTTVLTGDFDGDGADDLLLGVGRSGYPDGYAETFRIVFGPFVRGFHYSNQPTLTISPAPASSLYAGVAHDYDGDGRLDLPLHTWFGDGTSVRLVSGATIAARRQAGLPASIVPLEDASVALRPPADQTQSWPESSGWLPDLDGDGNDELFVNASGYLAAGADPDGSRGALVVISGACLQPGAAPTGLVLGAESGCELPAGRWRGFVLKAVEPDAIAYTGSTPALFDLDGDGQPEFLVGGRMQIEPHRWAYVTLGFRLPLSGTVDTSAAAWRFEWSSLLQPPPGRGTDFDGDGRPELLLRSGGLGAVAATDFIEAPVESKVWPEGVTNTFGDAELSPVAWVGDLNADGLADAALPRQATWAPDGARLWFGHRPTPDQPTTREVIVSRLSGTVAVEPIACEVDLDGDGWQDLLLSATSWRDGQTVLLGYAGPFTAP